ncbi:Rv2231c family pyridoxal phosphate-dependent protein CobC [Intrasporangium flavum]|uniref:Rv2231c family pyridoxal phosphate-dependent protein CobC n=1 Tax=Intrasporangium flavum TaxID=1428657 RepID=UPI00096BFB6D|nr:Rv2231c family pyridoxal phosphate-dependent protein CobC [Intrasporangium flavum]
MSVDLHHHGDRDVAAGLVDLAVNVRLPAPPPWLADVVARSLADLGRYPDATAATEAVAARHGVPVEAVLPTAGGAEAFTLVARALDVRRPSVVHPQFTEPEAALRAAGHDVHRHVLDAADGFRLDPAAYRAGGRSRTGAGAADLVVVGNPTNPTGVLHPRADVLALRAPGRTLVVDEAFMDAVPGEAESVLGHGEDLDGVLVLRSLTKTWGLAGLRTGYVVGDPALVARLRAVQPPWSVSTPALAATVACTSDRASAEAEAAALAFRRDRAVLVAELDAAGFAVAGTPATPFVLVDTSPLGPASVREDLAARGFAVRRGETFPGLGPTWIRVAVRDVATSRAFVSALSELRSRRVA